MNMSLWSDLVSVVRTVLGGIFTPSCSIPWQPNALAPVYFGYRDYHVRFQPTVEGALSRTAAGSSNELPSTHTRVFFPSRDPGIDSLPSEAAILQYCGHYPLIVFAHGECDTDVEQYKKWYVIPSLLARCGYVVAVPDLVQIGNGEDDPDSGVHDLDLLHDLIGWMRTSWEYANTLMPPPATGLVAHSHGCGFTARLASMLPNEISAWAGLSGVSAAGYRPIASYGFPKLFIWGSGNGEATQLTFNPFPDSGWDSVAAPKHSVVLKGVNHYDYIPPGLSTCGPVRGDCSLTPVMAAELLMMFFGRYLRPENAPDLRGPIPSSLMPPKFASLQLTNLQVFYAGNFLTGFENLSTNSPCGAHMAWDIGGGDNGTTTVP
jgi:alpha/beta hydrolase fold